MKQIVIINGVSSSGCSSLVDRFCSVVEDGYHKVHVDEYCKQLPSGMWERCGHSDAGWAEIGKSFNKHLAALAHRYDRIIADALYKLPSASEHLFSTLGRDRVFFVQLYCEIEELERREAARGDRPPGLARSQFNAVYSFDDYDLWIDSTRKSVDECVKELWAELSNQALCRS